MGTKININTILRQDIAEPLDLGKDYPFEKDELSVFADDMQIWLAKKDWTALAEIRITSQQRKDGKTTGSFKVEYIYNDAEQEQLTAVFRRMYGWE